MPRLLPQLSPLPARICALLGAVATVLLLGQSLHGLGWWKTVPLPAAKIAPLETWWKTTLPERYRDTLTEERGVILEDGQPLGTRAHSRRDFENSGGPRFYISRHKTIIHLRTADLSNPAANGRSYALRIPFPVPVWTAVVAFGIFLLGAASWPRQPAAAAVPEPAKWWKWAPLLLAVGATTLRLLEIAADPDFHDGVLSVRGMPYSDAVMWNEMGLSLAEGRGLAGGFDGQRPFYSYLLGCIFSFTGPSALAPQILNAFCHGITVGLVFLLGRAMGSRLLGFAGAALVTFTGEHAYQVRVIMTEQAGLVLSLTGILLMLGWRQSPAAAPWKRWLRLLFAGVFLALGNLACPVILFSLPFFCLLVSRPGVPDDPRPWWRRWDFRPGVALGVGACLVFLPWLGRQKSVHGIATLSTQAADLLYATAATNGPLGEWMGDELEAHGIASLAGPTPERYAYFMKRFAETVREAPLRYAGKLGRAALKFTCYPANGGPAPELIVVLALFAAAAVQWWRHGRLASLFAWALCAVPAWLLVEFMGQYLWSIPSGDQWPGVDVTVYPLVLAAAFVLLWWKAPAARTGLAVLAWVLVGCMLTHAIAGSTLLRRSSVFADWAQWLILVGALLSIQEWVAGFFLRQSAAKTETADGIPLAAENPLIFGAAALAILLSVAGAVKILTTTQPPTPAPASASLRRDILVWAASAAPAEVARAGGTDALKVLPVRLAPYRTFIPANEDASDFGRLFFRQPFDRTVLLVRPPPAPGRAGSDSRRRMVTPVSAMIRGGYFREVSGGQWFMAVARPDVDRNAKLHHDPVILQILALLPLGSDEAVSFDAAEIFPLP